MALSHEISGQKIALSEMKFRRRPVLEWYVIYTYAKAERNVQIELVKMNYEVFLPSVRTLRVWKNRQKKWIDMVLFPGYLFVHTLLSELYYITKIPKVVSCVQFGGRPSTIPVKEIECIKKMIGLDQELMVTTQFFEGEKVNIIRGPLRGYTGTLVKYRGKTRFGIQLNEINHTILIEIKLDSIERSGKQ
jgi:transcription antitermination factor NusG